MAFKKLDVPAIVLGETRVLHASSTRLDGTVPGVLCRCYNCQKEFGVCVGDYRRGRGLFCTQACNREYRTLTPEQRFWPKVNKTETCWLWTGYTMPFGHGQIHTRYGAKLVHRLSWELHYGPIPDSLEVCHHCDVPQCVRPDHLFLGSQADNMRDAYSKNRLAKGERNGHAKLAECDVLSIFDMRSRGEKETVIAEHFNVSRGTINSILRRQNWKHINTP